MALRKEIRHLDDMKKVLADRFWLKTAKNFPVYYVLREAKKIKDISYDVTLMPPHQLGKELAKTKGNRNSNGFLELYTALAGRAILLLQKTKADTVQDVMAIVLKKGDYFVIPRLYATITINPSPRLPLKIATWTAKKNKNIYTELEKRQGACYYYTKSGWIKNNNYKKIPKLRFAKPLKKKPEDLSFLLESKK